MEFLVRGGIKPSGNLQVWGGLPNFLPGETYLLMVKGGSYHVSPFVDMNRGVYREVSVGNKSVLLSDDGRGVVGIGDSGFLLGPQVAPPSQVTFRNFAGSPDSQLVVRDADQDASRAIASCEEHCLKATDALEELKERISWLQSEAPERFAGQADVESRPEPIPAQRRGGAQ